MDEGWRFYNHAVIPACAPHEEEKITEIEAENVVAINKAIFARWITNWDCGYETSFWYVIKDTPFDIEKLKSKKRYEINKGNRNFEIRLIDPTKELDAVYKVTLAAYASWPEKYRPKVTKKQMENTVLEWREQLFFGAYSKENNTLSGYAVVYDYGSWASFSVLRVNPDEERLGVNAALIYGILTEFRDRFSVGGFYISDGARAIRHETNFQEYLEKYFAFRKAYCKLNIKYNMAFGFVVKMLYPLRKLINGKTRLGSNVLSVLKMEEISRDF